MGLDIALQTDRVWESQKACAAVGAMRIKLNSKINLLLCLNSYEGYHCN